MPSIWGYSLKYSILLPWPTTLKYYRSVDPDIISLETSEHLPPLKTSECLLDLKLREGLSSNGIPLLGYNVVELWLQSHST